jgi:hypothetical protein
VSGQSGSQGPLRAVLAAFADGALTLDEVGRRADLPPDIVRLAVDKLVEMGRLDMGELSTGCPVDGCGECASGIGGTPGCAAPSDSRSGPALVTLRLTGDNERL